jgi:uncharacterized protein DUF1413
MRTIKTRVEDDVYASLVKMRRAARLPSVSSLFLSKCNLLTDHAEASEITRLALKAAKQQRSGSEYRLRDLFRKTRWQGFSKGARLRAGKMFYEEVSSAVYGIRATRKSSTNHQIYETA